MTHGFEYDAALFGTEIGTVERSIYGLQAKTAAHDGSWGMGRAECNVDLLAGTIVFTNETFKATANVQVIGTYNTADGSFMWGWDHPSVPPHCAQHAQKVKDWAEQQGLSALLERIIYCSEEDAWMFTALGAELADAQGAYRGPTGQALVYMTFGEVTLTQP